MQDYVEDLIRDWDLIDLKPKSGHFTWSNHRVGVANILARLNRFLVHSTLMDDKIISSKILPKLSLDHHPICLLFDFEENLGPIPFRFSPIWIERTGFMDIVSQVWSQFIVGSPSYVFE